jgi:hypothetical protein
MDGNEVVVAASASGAGFFRGLRGQLGQALDSLDVVLFLGGGECRPLLRQLQKL